MLSSGRTRGRDSSGGAKTSQVFDLLGRGCNVRDFFLQELLSILIASGARLVTRASGRTSSSRDGAGRRSGRRIGVFRTPFRTHSLLIVRSLVFGFTLTVIRGSGRGLLATRVLGSGLRRNVLLSLSRCIRIRTSFSSSTAAILTLLRLGALLRTGSSGRRATRPVDLRSRLFGLGSAIFRPQLRVGRRRVLGSFRRRGTGNA